MKAPTQHDQIMIMIQKKLKQGMHKTEARQMLRKHVFFSVSPVNILLYTKKTEITKYIVLYVSKYLVGQNRNKTSRKSRPKEVSMAKAEVKNFK